MYKIITIYQDMPNTHLVVIVRTYICRAMPGNRVLEIVCYFQTFLNDFVRKNV